MGTRMVSAAESPVHDNYKGLIVESAETGTVMLNRFHKPGFRVLATPYSEAREQSAEQVPMASLDGMLSLYFDGDLDAAFAFGGQVAGRIDAVRPVQEIIERDDRGVPRHAARRSRRGTRSGVSALDGLRVLEVVGRHRGRVRREVAARPGRRGGQARPPDGDPLRRWSAATPDAPTAGTGALFAFLHAGKASVTPHADRRPQRPVVVRAVGRRRARPSGARSAELPGMRRRRRPDVARGDAGDHRAVRRRRAARRRAGSEFTLQAWCGLMSGCGTPADAAAADGDPPRAVGDGRGRRRWPRSPACAQQRATGTGPAIEVSALEVMAVVPQQLPAALPAVHRFGVVHVAQRRLAAGRAAARTAGSACACSRRSSGPTSPR